MTTKLLWFVLAGFLLGFVTSTLWEWFYFRKERLKLNDRRIRELEAKLRDLETTPTGPVPSNSGPTSAWGNQDYRSPGVFLETEEFEKEDDPTSEPEQDRARAPSPDSSSAASVMAFSALPSASVPMKSDDRSIVPRPELRPEGHVEQSPADSLRARRGENARSRQELLATLRRNSEPPQRGQVSLRTEGQADSQNESAKAEPEVRLPTKSASTLISPTPPASQESQARQISSDNAFSTVRGVTPAAAQFVNDSSTSQAEPPAALVVKPARQKWAGNADLTRRTQEYPDDLSKIKGIGDVYKQRLYRAGIYTWKQIAENDLETLRRATSAYPSSNVDEWLIQARQLMEKQGRANAVYSGPPPDDFTKILGIGPVSAAALYRAGICTYEQLASTSITDLAALFPIAVAGDQPDFAQWLTRSAELADEKHSEKHSEKQSEKLGR